ncbi:uncharacterized protein HMPREF1541_00795 [Cyphellophora europaea CBS 101466]|uniref:DNA (cytosine-5-)-methyltransferase n=1 Tax=Cyphellophora europaea (strain CBS 101466) TaxID=1220924 RepID=W2SFC5_CYPE1|nr:uncharacterized protein HMPREF1541_00795 [Cyphellophora europaea CBS 101466]ETN46609.1 hypothetical protein HMPREF1541_00795 [Cyphellophora europaea CBS 101466]
MDAPAPSLHRAPREVIHISDSEDEALVNSAFPRDSVIPLTHSFLHPASNHTVPESGGDDDDDDEDTDIVLSHARRRFRVAVSDSLYPNKPITPSPSPRTKSQIRRIRLERLSRSRSVQSYNDDPHAQKENHAYHIEENSLSSSDDFVVDDDDYDSDHDLSDVEEPAHAHRETSHRRTGAQEIDKETDDEDDLESDNRLEERRSEPQIDGSRVRSTGSMVPRAGTEHRQQFQHRLAEIENQQDLHKLYPVSLQRVLDSNSSQLAGPIGEAPALVQLIPLPSLLGKTTLNFDLELRDFSLYQEVQQGGKGFGGQLVSPYTAILKSVDCVIDGTLQNKYAYRKVESMTCLQLIVEKLDDPSVATTKEHIFLQTQEGASQKVRYRLTVPALVYHEHWENFTWILDLTKYVVHFLCAASEQGRRATLHDFRNEFWIFVRNYYSEPESDHVVHWHCACGLTTDFRKHILRYGEFLRAKAIDLMNNRRLDDLFLHDVWDDIGWPLSRNRKLSRTEKTVVTPEVASAFLQSFPLWGPDGHDILETVDMNPAVVEADRRRQTFLSLPNKFEAQDQNFRTIDGKRISRVALALESAALNPLYPQFSSHEVLGRAVVVRQGDSYRFAYARGITGVDKVEIVWLLLPSEASCGTQEDAFYPVGNELFFSSECSCRPVSVHKIVACYEVDTFAERSLSPDGFFIHGLYRSDSQEHATADAAEILSGCIQHQAEQAPPAVLPAPEQVSKLKVLSLFSGAGLLDHSIASTGYFTPTFAIDLDKAAHLSYKANTESNCRHIHGSTNGYLRDVLTGCETLMNPDLLVAGFACKGYSKLNAHKSNVSAHRNCSLLANTLSLVSILRPKYVLIENVPDMDSANLQARKANACSQAICSLVAMGYQVYKTLVCGSEIDAISKRKRLFIVAAAPGLKLPRNPVEYSTNEQTNVYEVIQDLDLGKADVTNDTVLNVERPDHIPFERLPVDFDFRVALRDIVRRVPIDGDRRDLYAAYTGGHLSRLQNRWFEAQTEEKQKSGSKALKRLPADGLFPTITSVIVPINSRGMACLHPFQHRVLTVEELRRGQGLPDDFLLVGTIREVIEQIGNGVVWQVGEVWGRSIADAAWASGLLEKKDGGDVEGKDDGNNKHGNDDSNPQESPTEGPGNEQELRKRERSESVAFVEERPAKCSRVE